MTLEEQFDKLEYLVSMLLDIRDKVDLYQKSNALLLAEVAGLKSQIEIVKAIVSRRFRTQNDAAVARRERGYS
jgi:hypothetical protein